jgi:hypothetical protein
MELESTNFRISVPPVVCLTLPKKDFVKAGRVKIMDARKVLPLFKDETRVEVEALRKSVVWMMMLTRLCRSTILYEPNDE